MMQSSNADIYLDVKSIRNDFPLLHQKVHDKPLVYFDNGATTQKPRSVIDFIKDFYDSKYSSIHRGVHYLSEQATEAYENARKTIQQFINAKSSHEIIFTGGTTASINGIAYSFGEAYVKAGDEIIISEMEHHANIIPWQVMAERKKAHLKILPFDDTGELMTDALPDLITEKTRIISINHVSNILGTINPVKEIIRIAHKHHIPVMLDGAQAIQHGNVDVQELDCDFYAFSGHKIYGPTGIGVLYGKEKWLEALPPFLVGGEMVDKVSFEKTTYQDLPLKFEAGTPNFVGAIGMGKAISYFQHLDIKQVLEHEKGLLHYATGQLKDMDHVRIYGNSKNKISIISFNLEGIHHYDAGMILDKLGIAVRTGTHCGQTIMQHYNIEGSIRASMVFYNTREEIDRFIDGIKQVKKLFQ